MSEYVKKMHAVLDRVKDILHARSQEYGSSLFEPLHAWVLCAARIEDKLARLRHQIATGRDAEDTICDLIGYLAALQVLLSRHKEDQGHGPDSSSRT